MNSPNDQEAPGGGALVAKLAEVMAEVRNVPKNGFNAAQNYHYVQEADLLEVVRDALSQRGIVLVPRVRVEQVQYLRDLPPEGGSSERKGVRTSILVPVDWEICLGDQVITATVLGEAFDAGDKAAGKAQTAALKTLLVKLFLIPAGDGETDPARSPQRQAAQSQGLSRAQRAGEAMADHAKAAHDRATAGAPTGAAAPATNADISTVVDRARKANGLPEFVNAFPMFTRGGATAGDVARALYWLEQRNA